MIIRVSGGTSHQGRGTPSLNARLDEEAMSLDEQEGGAVDGEEDKRPSDWGLLTAALPMQLVCGTVFQTVRPNRDGLKIRPTAVLHWQRSSQLGILGERYEL